MTDPADKLELPEDLASGARIIVGMSGGVDSSVTAWLLQRHGFAVEGLFMKNWDEDDGTEYCTAQADLADARAVCEVLGVPLHEANFAAEYWDNVFEDFLTEYRAGRTPNPDILCNREIKFNVFARYARMLGADWIATGHYARVQHGPGGARLLKGADPGKDQSYFLQAVSGDQLRGCLFPLGQYLKSEVRELAHDAGLPTFAKKDSTGICFIGERRFADFLASYVKADPGPIVSVDGERLGTHNGLVFHTLGQRQGLGIGGVRGASDAPWYVVAKRTQDNTLVVAQGNNHPALFSSAVRCEDAHWIAGTPPPSGHHAIKTRYRQPDQFAEIVVSGAAVTATFDVPQRAVTPGQWLCIYQGDECLGGAIIDGTEPA